MGSRQGPAGGRRHRVRPRRRLVAVLPRTRRRTPRTHQRPAAARCTASPSADGTRPPRRYDRRMEFHFATVWESLADELGDHTAVVHGDRRFTWREYDERAARVAAVFTAAGLGADSQDRPVPLQRQRVPRGPLRRVQDARRAHQRELPVPRRRARVPARQRRRRGAGVPLLAGRPGRAHPRPPAEAEAARRGRRRWRRSGAHRPPLRGGPRQPRADAAHHPQRGRHLHAVHRRHHRHAQGRDVRHGRTSRARSPRCGFPLIGLAPPDDAVADRRPW